MSRDVELLHLTGKPATGGIGFAQYRLHTEIRIGLFLKHKHDSHALGMDQGRLRMLLVHHHRRRKDGLGLEYTGARRRDQRGNSFDRRIQYAQEWLPILVGKFKLAGQVIFQRIAICLQKLVLLFVPITNAVKIIGSIRVEELEENDDFRQTKCVALIHIITARIKMALLILFDHDQIGLPIERHTRLYHFILGILDLRLLCPKKILRRRKHLRTTQHP